MKVINLRNTESRADSVSAKVSKSDRFYEVDHRPVFAPLNAAIVVVVVVVCLRFTFTRFQGVARSRGSREEEAVTSVVPGPPTRLVVCASSSSLFFFSRVISVGARSFHGEKRPTTGGWRYTSRGPRSPAERTDGQTDNENEECPAEPDMKTSLRNGNGQDGVRPGLTVPNWLVPAALCPVSQLVDSAGPPARRSRSVEKHLLRDEIPVLEEVYLRWLSSGDSLSESANSQVGIHSQI